MSDCPPCITGLNRKNSARIDQVKYRFDQYKKWVVCSHVTILPIKLLALYEYTTI